MVQASGSRQKPIWGRVRGLGQRGARQKTSGRVCFICGDLDLIRPNCPHLHDCHRCLRPGHIARNCTALVPIVPEADLGYVPDVPERSQNFLEK